MAESQDEAQAEKPESTPEERIRAHNATLTAEDVDFVRAKLLATTHTAPGVERALTVALDELGFRKREPEEEPRP